jgi:2-phosphoglycerate kinase
MVTMIDMKTRSEYIATMEHTPPDTKPIFVVLGGTYGVGKTTIAHHLGIELSIMQRVGLGGITKTIRTLLPENEIVKNWHIYDRTAPDQVHTKLRRESELIGRVITTILDSAEKSGESYIIDGVQLLPEFLPLSKLHMFILSVPNPDEHRQRFEHPTITRTRHLNNSTFELTQIVQGIILEESRSYGIPVIENVSSPQETARQIALMLGTSRMAV